MKKIVALILAAVILCSCASVLAEGVPPIPGLDTFAKMITETKNRVYTISLSKPVDQLYVNWPNELRVVPLAVSENLRASVLLIGQNTQPGVAKVVAHYDGFGGVHDHPVATFEDRAVITVQGDWIVCYNREGVIVAVAYAKGADIQAVRDVAFSDFGKTATGIIVTPLLDF